MSRASRLKKMVAEKIADAIRENYNVSVSYSEVYGDDEVLFEISSSDYEVLTEINTDYFEGNKYDIQEAGDEYILKSFIDFDDDFEEDDDDDDDDEEEKYARGGKLKRKRVRYTYIPNSEIESLTTWGGKELKGSQLLDGAYARGDVKYADGGMMDNEVSEDRYDDMLGAVPPIYFNTLDGVSVKGGFAVGEVYSHEPIDGKYRGVYTAFYRKGDSFYEVNGMVYFDGKSSAKRANIYADGGMFFGGMAKGMSVEQQAQDMIGDSWFSMTDEQRATAIAQFATDGILTSSFADGGGVGTTKYIVTFKVGKKKIVKNFESQAEMEDAISDFYLNNENVDDINIEEVKEKVDIFKAAKKESKPSSKKEKDMVEIEGLEDDINRLNELKAIEKNAKSEAEVLKGKIKEAAREKFIEKYKQMGARPENFRVYDGDADILFIVQDNYITVSEEKAEILKEEYPDFLSEKTTYKISESMLKKPSKDGRTIGDVLNELISNTDAISNEDKVNLFTVTKEKSIADGSIDRLAKYDDIEQVYNLIQPIEALK